MTADVGAPATLPAPWADDPFLLDDRPLWSPARVVARDGALLLVQRAVAASGAPGTRTSLIVLGPAGPASDLLRDHDDATHAVAWVDTAALGMLRPAEVARLGLLPARTGWEWMVTEQAPPAVTGEVAVRELDPVADADAIRACLAAANPTTDADPAGPGERWWGSGAPDGTLAGVIGSGPRAGRGGRRAGEPGSAGSAHLHGLGVRPGDRGRGLGAALTAAATRALLADGADWVSLGMWDDNDGARRIYHRLGLRTVHRMTTLRHP
ncbi:GNAT family N-acetyltransferase [Cellulomonas sp. P4]|uniref:GNAT family N-acetyltransferase n=1 Tax=Cellulomonas sp. P4 TaxID=3142533 RepID=UPI0031B9C7B6